MTRVRCPFPIALLAAGLTIALLVFASCKVLAREDQRVLGVTLAISCFIPWLLALRLRGQLGSGRRATVTILVGALVIRLAAFGLPPVLSDDLHRFVFDGYVLLSGRNPMSLPPSAPELGAVREVSPSADLINHPKLATIYPPLAQIFFAAGVWIGDGAGIKALVTLADLLLCAALIALLIRRGRAPADALFYAWNPFCAIEYTGSGHYDPLMWMLALWAFFLLSPRRDDAPPGRFACISAGALLGAAVLAKLFAIVALPFLLTRRRHWPALATALVVIALGFAPFVWPLSDSPASGFFATLANYGAKWRWNEGAFALIEGLVITVGDLDPLVQGPTWIAALTKVVIAIPVALGCAIFFIASARLRTDPSITPAERATAALIAIGILLGPIVHPWYVGWALPFAVLSRNPAFFYLAAVAWLSYLPLPADAANVPWYWRTIEHLPVLVLMPIFARKSARAACFTRCQ